MVVSNDFNLTETLEKNGASNSKLKNICGEYVFDFAMLQDQSEIYVDGEQLRQTICFKNSNGIFKYNSLGQCQIHE